MDQIVQALTQEQIKAIEAGQQVSAPNQPEGAQTPPTGFANASGRTKVVTLEWPVTHGGETITEVSLRRLTGHDFQKLTRIIQDGSDENAILLGIMSGLSPAVINTLDADDFVALSEAAKDFLPRRLVAEIERTSGTGEATQP